MFVFPTARASLSVLRASCGSHCKCAALLESYGNLFSDDPEVEGEVAVMAMNLSGFVPTALSEANAPSTAMQAQLRAFVKPPFPEDIEAEPDPYAQVHVGFVQA